MIVVYQTLRCGIPPFLLEVKEAAAHQKTVLSDGFLFNRPGLGKLSFWFIAKRNAQPTSCDDGVAMDIDAFGDGQGVIEGNICNLGVFHCNHASKPA